MTCPYAYALQFSDTVNPPTDEDGTHFGVWSDEFWAMSDESPLSIDLMNRIYYAREMNHA